MRASPGLVECPICRCRLSVPRGYGRRTVSCQNGHLISIEKPWRRERRRAPRWPAAVVTTFLLLALLLAATGWPLHLSVLRRFVG